LFRFGNVGFGSVHNEESLVVFCHDPVGIRIFVDPNKGKIGRYREIPAIKHFTIAFVDMVFLPACNREIDISVSIYVPFLYIFFQWEVDTFGNPYEIIGPVPIWSFLG
jgi:hypothetical protein